MLIEEHVHAAKPAIGTALDLDRYDLLAVLDQVIDLGVAGTRFTVLAPRSNSGFRCGSARHCARW